MSCRFVEQPSLQFRFQYLCCIELFERQAMCGGLNQRCLWHKSDDFAPRYCHSPLCCAGSDRFKSGMDRRDDVIGEVHRHLNELSTG